MIEIPTIIKTSDGWIFNLELDSFSGASSEDKLVYIAADSTTLDFEQAIRSIVFPDGNSMLPYLTVLRVESPETIQSYLPISWFGFQEFIDLLPENKLVNVNEVINGYLLGIKGFWSAYPRWLTLLKQKLKEEEELYPRELGAIVTNILQDPSLHNCKYCSEALVTS
jgi:hypothetical protein